MDCCDAMRLGLAGTHWLALGFSVVVLCVTKTRRSLSVWDNIASLPSPQPRYSQEHAHELNGVLISNRLAHAELLGTMEKQDFAFAVGVRRCGPT